MSGTRRGAQAGDVGLLANENAPPGGSGEDQVERCAVVVGAALASRFGVPRKQWWLVKPTVGRRIRGFTLGPHTERAHNDGPGRCLTHGQGTRSTSNPSCRARRVQGDLISRSGQWLDEKKGGV